MYILSLLQNPLMVVIFLCILVITVTVHEYAHAYAADKLGDPTPSLAGRLTLDPRAHLDKWGSILFLLFGFGWGKPVPFDPYNLKDPRRDSAIISFAGPLSNILVAILCSLLAHQILNLGLGGLWTLASAILTMAIHLNVTLALFNLLPFSPLDGFKIVGGLLPDDQAHDWYSLERYGLFFLLFSLLPFAGNKSMLDIFLFPAIQMVTGILTP